MNTVKNVAETTVLTAIDILIIIVLAFVAVTTLYIALHGFDAYLALWSNAIDQYNHKQWCEANTVRCTIQDLF